MEENIKAGPSTFETLLPALFIKFIEHMDPHHNGRELLMKSTKKTKTIKINKSILRDNESIHKFVPNLINIKENPKENIYATYCIYRKAHFIIKFVIQLH